jgi:hypothetical protein
MIRKYSKAIILFLIVCLLMPMASVSATDLGWPIDVNANEGATDVEEEALPESAVEESVTVEGSVGAIDEGSVDLDDKVIFPEEEYGLINRLNGSINTTGDYDELDMAGKIYSNYADVVPTVTTDQMVEWILRKGNEIISILQIFAQPFAIIIFIVSCAIALIGSLTKGNMAGKGLIGMVASAILYAACLYAPVIVNSISNFMAS